MTDNNITNLSSLILVINLFLLFSCSDKAQEQIGKTEILLWPDGKKTAVSLTWDDGSLNQFRVALPIMDSLDFAATFYVNTGNIEGSEYLPEYLGRPVPDILDESREIPTNQNNLFERASMVAYADYEGLREFHTRAGTAFESGNKKEACSIIDEALAKLKAGNMRKRVPGDGAGRQALSWEDLDTVQSNGHEIGSHTISHPRLAVLDEKHMLYELKKSKEDILNHLGPEHTFSAECPYGTEDERVMEFAYEIYPALRNRMPEPFLDELNRSSNKNPGSSDKTYVQWQRGPLTDTPMDLMKSWVDTCLLKNNIWLVLVFHGVEGVGWEPKSREELVEYFNYLKEKEKNIWIGTFQHVAKYIRERMNSDLHVNQRSEKLEIKLTHSLSDKYNYPLSLKTYLPDSWDSVSIRQGNSYIKFQKKSDEEGKYILFNAVPNRGVLSINRLSDYK